MEIINFYLIYGYRTDKLIIVYQKNFVPLKFFFSKYLCLIIFMEKINFYLIYGYRTLTYITIL